MPQLLLCRCACCRLRLVPPERARLLTCGDEGCRLVYRLEEVHPRRQPRQPRRAAPPQLRRAS